MRRLAVPSVLLLVAGCSGGIARARPKAATATASPPPPAEPVAPPMLARGEVDLPDEVPLSIKRLVSEQRVELDDIRVLIAPLTDPRGRARATGDLDAMASELVQIERDLRTRGAGSERFDATVSTLQRLATRTSLMHEALRGAVATTALELDPRR